MTAKPVSALERIDAILTNPATFALAELLSERIGPTEDDVPTIRGTW